MVDGLVARLKASLNKTRRKLLAPLEEAVHFHKKISPEFYEELEEILITSDVGYATTMLLMEKLKAKVKTEKAEETTVVQGYLHGIITEILSAAPPPALDGDEPLALLLVGVNGVGKTTSIAKFTEYYTAQGKSCLLVAGDTFRAAAIDQLAVWAKRMGVSLISHQAGADPGAEGAQDRGAQGGRAQDRTLEGFDERPQGADREWATFVVSGSGESGQAAAVTSTRGGRHCSSCRTRMRAREMP